MDLCHLKKSELEPQFQKDNGRVVLRGDIVKDDSGSYAVFTEQGASASQMKNARFMDIEQGSSASQMTAAKVMDVISNREYSEILKNARSQTGKTYRTSHAM